MSTTPSLTLEQFLKQIGLNQQYILGLQQQQQQQQSETITYDGYNIIALDGIKTTSTLSSLKSQNSPISLWLTIYQKIVGSINNKLGSSSSEIQKNIMEKLKYKSKNNKKVLILGNAFSFQNSIPSKTISQSLSPSLIASNIAEIILTNSLDGVIIQWDDFNSVNDGTADQWLLNLLKSLRNLLKKSQKIIALSTYPTLMTKMSIFQDQNCNFYIDLYIIKYFNNLQGDFKFNTYQSIFTTGSGNSTSLSIKSFLQNPKYTFDICKTIISKPITDKFPYQSSNFVNDLTLNSFMIKAYNQYGWFSGFSNPHLNGKTIDSDVNFMKRTLADLRSQCWKTKLCFCG